MSKMVMVRLPDLLYRRIKARSDEINEPMATIIKNVLEHEFNCPISRNKGRMSKTQKKDYHDKAIKMQEEYTNREYNFRKADPWKE